MSVRLLAIAGLAGALIVCGPSRVSAAPAGLQARPAAPGAVSGAVTNSLSGAPVAGALVVLQPLESTAGSRQVAAGPDGRYQLTGIAPGTYHLVARADGFLATRKDVTVTTAPMVVDVAISPELHFSEVTSVSPEARNQFDSYQPTTVLGGQDLAKVLQSTVAATLANEPGIATRGFGPGPARPVIRGLDGDRVLVLEDGNRMGDLSSQSGDHGINTNPASAQKIEVVRGPATLLYGANAIGGLVNVVTRNIPTARVAGPTGSLTFDGGSAARETTAAGEITFGSGNVAAHVSASGHRAENYRSPDGEIENSFNRGGAVQAGLSLVGDHGYAGASVAWDKSHYGIPFVEDGETNLDPRRLMLDFRGERRDLGGFVQSFRVTGAMRRYNHDERDGETIATAFTNDVNEVEIIANHRQAGRLKGSFGGWAMTRMFLSEGEEALSPQVDQKAFAAFLYEEATLTPHVSFQFGGRIDHTTFTPDGLADRSFTNVSGSLGLLMRPTDQTTIALNAALAARNPALEELYFEGPHAGNNAFEVGDATLESERATGFDVSIRHQSGRLGGEVAYFYNDVRNFIFRRLTGDIEDGLAVAEFAQGDAVLQGIEAHLDLRVSNLLSVEGGFDYVKGDLNTLGVPLPRIPPMRGRFGLRFQKNAFQAGVDVHLVSMQDRVFTTPLGGGALNETATDGYGLTKAYMAYSFSAGKVLHTLALRADNAGNVRYRNHLNYLKDLAPEVGRDVRLTYTIKF